MFDENKNVSEAKEMEIKGRANEYNVTLKCWKLHNLRLTAETNSLNIQVSQGVQNAYAIELSRSFHSIYQ